MIALLAVGAVAIVPVVVLFLIIALLVGLLGSAAERELGVGLFADRDA